MALRNHKTIISNYLKVKSLGKGAMGEVFEVISIDDPTQKYALKFVSGKKIGWVGWFHRFHNEAALMSQLYHSHVISLKEYGLVKDQRKAMLVNKDINSYFIAMDFVDGQDLKRIISSNGKKGMSLNFFFQLACQLASALDYTHGKNIIHRDVKPHNIIVESLYYNSIHARLIDFGVASLGEATNYIGGNTSSILDRVAGTPLYMAPEVLGETKVKVDHRVDLYSLGCVLYEVLAGRPPFLARTRAELESKHAKVKPQHISTFREDIPKLVGDIVSRLMEKDPDDRYQTAFSLYSDLKVAKRIFVKGHSGSVQSINLGLNNQFKSMGRSYKLIGRTRQISQLIKFYNNVSHRSSRGHVSLVTGKSGSGKSRLLREFKEYLVTRKVKFISCSFMKYKTSVSMQSFTSGFDEYLLKVRNNNPLEAKKIRDRLHNNLGERIKIIKDLVPSISLFIKKSMLSSFAYSTENVDSHVMSKVFTDFTRSLISSDQPIVFVFDDIDFADELSLKIIKDFFTFNNSERIYLVLSCSTTEESGRKKHVEDFLLTMQEFKRRYQEVALTPLTLHQVANLVYHILNVEVDSIIPLCNYLYKVCQGNPVYLIEKLRDLVLHGDIRHDFETKSWIYNLQELELVNRPLVSVDLILSRLAGYNKYLIRVLEIASVSGLNFREDVLYVVDGISHVELRKILIFLCSESLIRETKSIYEGSKEIRRFQFVHPHIREVVLEHIDAKKLPAYHLAIVAKLCSVVKNHNDKIVFAIANHYYQGLFKAGSRYKPKKSVLERAVFYATKAAQLGNQMQEYYCALKYYDFVILLVNRYLRKSISLNSLLMLYVESCKIRFYLGSFKKASLQLDKVFSIVQKTSTGGLPKKLYVLAIRYYFLLLQRDSNYAKIRQLSMYMQHGLGLPQRLRFGSGKYFAKMNFCLGLFYDYCYYVLGLSWMPSPTHKILCSIFGYQKKITFRSLMYYNLYYLSLQDSKDASMKTHLLALQSLKIHHAHIDDLLDLLFFRLRILSSFKLYKVNELVLHCARKIFQAKCKRNKNSLFSESSKFSLMLDYMDFCFFLYPGAQHYSFSTKLLSEKRSDVLDVSMDIMMIIDFNSVALTRFLWQGKKEDFFELYRKTLDLCSSKTPAFPYLLLLSTFFSAIEDDMNSIQSFAAKIVYDKTSNTIHKGDAFFLLVKAYVLLSEDQYNTSKDYYFEVLSVMKEQDISSMHAYQMDFLVLAMMAFQDLYTLRSSRIFDNSKETMIFCFLRMQQSLKKYFFADSMMISFLKSMHLFYSSSQVNKKRGFDKEHYLYTSFEESRKHFAQNLYKVPFLFVLLKFANYLVNNQKKNLASIQLLHALSISRKYRLIAITKLVETSLLQANIPFPRRDLRGGVEKTVSRFDGFPSTLVYKTMLNIFPKLYEYTSEKILDDVARRFTQSYGGDVLYAISVQGENDLRVKYEMKDMCTFETASEALLDQLEPYLTANETVFIRLDNNICKAKKSSQPSLALKSNLKSSFKTSFKTSCGPFHNQKPSSVAAAAEKTVVSRRHFATKITDVTQTKVAEVTHSEAQKRLQIGEKASKSARVEKVVSKDTEETENIKDIEKTIVSERHVTLVSQVKKRSVQEKTKISKVVAPKDKQIMQSDKQKSDFAETVVANCADDINKTALSNKANVRSPKATTKGEAQKEASGMESVPYQFSDSEETRPEAQDQMLEHSDRVGCLVPIHLGSRQRFYIFVDRIGESHLAEEDIARSEISFWGAQVGCMFGGLGLFPVDTTYGKKAFQPKEVKLEACSWLELYVQKHFIRSSNGSWALGVNLGAWHYLLISLDISGSDKAAVLQFACMLWHYVWLLKYSYQYVGQKCSSVIVRNDILYFLKHHPMNDTFHQLKSVITIFDRSYKRVESMILGEVNARVFSESRMGAKQARSSVVFRFAGGGALKSQWISSALEDQSLVVFATGPADWSLSSKSLYVHSSKERTEEMGDKKVNLEKVAREFAKTSSIGHNERVASITCMFHSKQKPSHSGENSQQQYVAEDESLSA